MFAISVIAALALTGCAGGGAASAPAPAAPADNPAPAAAYLPGAVHVITREEGSGTRGAFVELFELVVDGQDMTYIGASISNSAGAIMTNVANDLNAIGYISLGSLNDTVTPISIGRVSGTAENIRNGSYIVSRPFNIATQGDVDALTRDFISFIMSAQGQAIAEDRGYVMVDDSAPEYESSGMSGTVTVGGSTSVAPLMERLKEAYEELNPDVFIEIQIMGSTAGMTGAIDGTLDIGMASRPLSASEQEVLDHMEIAHDGIIVIVNNENPLNDISFDTVREIFMGEVVVWAQLANQ